MSKIGVGIGEDFPADDREPAPNDVDCAARREAHLKWREQRRQWRHRWREEWRARKRALRDQRRDDSDDASGSSRDAPALFHSGHAIVWGVLALSAALVLIALVNFIFAHVFVIAGVVALLALFAAYHRLDPFDLPRHDYAHDTHAPRGEAAH